MRMTWSRWLAVVGWLVAAALAHAAPSAVLQVSSQSMTIGQTVLLEVRVQGAEDVSPASFTVTGFQLSAPEVSRQSSMTFNGRETRRIDTLTYRYRLTPLEEGRFTIGPVAVTADGQRLTTNAVTVTVEPPRPIEGVVVDVAVSNPNPYVGEPVELDITVLSDRQVMRGNFQVARIEDDFEVFEAYPSQSPDARTDAFGFGGQRTVSVSGIMRTGEGREYAVIMKRIIVPRRAGKIDLGPVILSGDQEYRRSTSIFDTGNTRSIVAPSDPLTLDVRPLPAEGRPPAFTGLVGRYDIFASAMPQQVSVGEPIELSILLKGSLVSRRIDLDLVDQAIAADFKLPDRLDPPEFTEQGQRYTVTIRALRDDVTEVPPIELPYFNAANGEYDVARSRAIPLKVASSTIVSSEDLVGADGTGLSARDVESAREGIAHNYDGPSVLQGQGFSLTGALATPATLALVAGPPAAYALMAGLVLVSRRRAGDVAGKRRREASAAIEAVRNASGTGADVAAAVSEAMYAYVAARFERAAAGLTPRDCEALLRERGVSEEASAACRGVLERCDAARFGGMDAAAAERLQSEALAVLETVDGVLRRRRS
ncbi:MAG: BatD family protein [Phycisphaerales bacterium]|nr:BatD family protein [Phycisphaerales bacterium]